MAVSQPVFLLPASSLLCRTFLRFIASDLVSTQANPHILATDMASASTEQVELDPAVQAKINVAKQKKDTGDQAFKAGDVTAGMIFI